MMHLRQMDLKWQKKPPETNNVQLDESWSIDTFDDYYFLVHREKNQIREFETLEECMGYYMRMVARNYKGFS